MTCNLYLNFDVSYNADTDLSEMCDVYMIHDIKKNSQMILDVCLVV